MRKNRSLISATIIIVITTLLLAACSVYPTKINRLYFISATGDENNTNCLYLSENNSNINLEELKSEDAVQLIDEIKKIPDATEDSGKLAFKIELVYTDQDTAVHEINKIGYDSFPDNWDTIVGLIDKLYEGKSNLTNSKDIVTIDSKYLQEHYEITDDMLPGDATIDNMITALPITYETLYAGGLRQNEYFDINKAVEDYKQLYFDMPSHQLTTGIPVVASSEEELKEFAEQRFDEVKAIGQYSASATYKGNDFQVVRTDMVEQWLDQYEGAKIEKSQGVFVYRRTWYDGELQANDQNHIYIDTSERFLIFSYCDDPEILYDLVR